MWLLCAARNGEARPLKGGELCADRAIDGWRAAGKRHIALGRISRHSTDHPEGDLQIRRLLAQSALALTIACGIATPVHATGYVVTDLGTLGGAWSEASDINAAGQVTGTAEVISGISHAFLYSNGQMTDLGTLGGSRSSGFGINSAGQVVGYADTTGNNKSRAALFSNGTVTSLGTLLFPGTPHPYPHGQAYGINDSGHAVGIVYGGFGEYRAFSYVNGTMTDIGVGLSPLTGPFNSRAMDINALGQVTGHTNGHASIYYNGVVTDLGTLGGTFSEGRSINDSGQVTGSSQFVVGSPDDHAFLHKDGVMIDLGTFGGLYSRGNSINAYGQVAGYAFTSDGVSHAFLYDGKALLDLNELIDPSSGWVLTSGNGINDAGQIVGSGFFNGERRAFMATPVPEVQTWAMLAAGLGLLRLRRRAPLQPWFRGRSPATPSV